METAIHDILNLVQKRLNEFNGLKGFEVTMMTQELNWFKDILNKSIEKEEQQIVDAFNYGYYCASNGSSDEFDLKGRRYYENRYKQNK
jgi:hypothetical protein